MENVKEKILAAISGFLVKFLSSEEKKIQVQVKITLPEPPAPVEPETPVVETKVEKPVAPKFTLIHRKFCEDGVFGELQKDGQFFCYTLEHSFDSKAKVVDGTYTCERGTHRLHTMTEDFITFEVKKVPDFNGVPVTGILFHWGNYNKDSDGCILLGSSETPTMVGNSRTTWADFIKTLDGFDSFELTVISEK